MPLASQAHSRLVAIGEILWDILPTGERLGGAPFNVASHAAQLGIEASAISAIGRDERGQRIAHMAADAGQASLDPLILQSHPQLPTGYVDVSLQEGQPDYIIHQPVAWDAIAWSDDVAALAARASVIVFGTLAQRDPRSRETIQRFLQSCPGSTLRFFDVNLRQHDWSRNIIEWSLHHATAIKLNEAELAVLIRELDLIDDEDMALDELAHTYGLSFFALTRGAQGCRLVRTKGWENVEARPDPIRVADAVGAGDAFSAALLVGLLKGHPLENIATHANAIGGYVASQHGAVPALPEELRTPSD